MGTVLRVLGIVLASMVLGVVALFVLLFSICGGFRGSEGAGVLAVCVLVMVGAFAVIVVLGRGISRTRAAARGLAVPPAGAAAAYSAPPAYGTAPTYGGPTITPQAPYAPPAPAGYPPLTPSPAASMPQTRPVLPLRPFTGTDLQALVGLRVCLAILILVSLGSVVFTFVSFGRLGYFGTSVAMQLILRGVLGVLPPAAVMVAVSVRNPPAGAALDATAGFGIASILFRFGYLAFAGFFVQAFRQADMLFTMLPRLGGYSLLEAGIAGLALYLRSRVGPLHPAALVVATLAFLFWEGLVQAIMTAMMGLMY